MSKGLPEGGTAIISGPPKVGKSGLVLNAAKAVCEGGTFLGVFDARQGRALYLQTEIPAWAMAERLKFMGDLPDGLLVCTPRQFHLNYFTEEGFKRVETGNRDRVAALVEALRQHAVSLLIIDPFAHFHTMNENSVEHISHLFSVLRSIARAVPCGVLVVHHHRKVARSQVRYEGAEDMRGSSALYAEADSVTSIYTEERTDGTRRYKLISSTRHAEEPEPLELRRYGGDRSWLWQAIPWKDSKSTVLDSTDLDILSALRSGPLTGAAIMEKTGATKATVYRRLDRLRETGKIEKTGNLYYFPGAVSRFRDFSDPSETDFESETA